MIKVYGRKCLISGCNEAIRVVRNQSLCTIQARYNGRWHDTSGIGYGSEMEATYLAQQMFAAHQAQHPCLMSFPANANLEDTCPRCKGEAGDHPAPVSLLDDQETPIWDRPTLREILVDLGTVPVI